MSGFKRSLTILAAAFLLSPSSVISQPRIEPIKVTGRAESFIRVESGLPGDVKWEAIDPGLSVFPPDLLNNKSVVVVFSSDPGEYLLMATSAKVVDGQAVILGPVRILVNVEPKIPVPPVPPGPTPPNPPGPTPPTPPTPPGPTPPTPPAPIPAPGLRVLIVWESSLQEALPRGQLHILRSVDSFKFLDEMTVLGPDGRTREWRIWDKDDDVSGAPLIWQNAMKRPKESIPWLIVSNGINGYEGPLPKTLEEFKELVRKYKLD